jgi:hypothetical protein
MIASTLIPARVGGDARGQLPDIPCIVREPFAMRSVRLGRLTLCSCERARSSECGVMAHLRSRARPTRLRACPQLFSSQVARPFVRLVPARRPFRSGEAIASLIGYLGVCKYNFPKTFRSIGISMIIMPLTCGYRNKCDLRHIGLHPVLPAVLAGHGGLVARPARAFDQTCSKNGW